ncbi:DUF2158 domain-containing protein [Aeromonas sanarellii]|uniref:DUF2158 domain-containing protein n=1 Tax=Aeromonas sanarellii TaxID=633415 RepID=UPI0039A0DFBF
MQKYPYLYPGYVVTLSSGGQHMTVMPASSEDDDESNDVRCVWFNTDLGGLPVEWVFPRCVLKRLDEENEPPYGHPHTRFDDGQVVKLRSGGPAMTVSDRFRTDGVSYVSCVWLDENNREPLSAAFHSEILTMHV